MQRIISHHFAFTWTNRPEPSVSAMPIAECSNMARKRASLSRTARKVRSRSVMSVATMSRAGRRT